jgi:hypothetical protein
VAEVLDDFLGLLATTGAVDVLEGRQCTPGDRLSRPRYCLESPAVAIPAGNTARQDALNGASVNV